MLDRESLHGSLADPVLGSVGFLTEIMAKYPDAISFAPGAPHATFLDDLDVDHYVEVYLAHLARAQGIPRQQGRRLLYEYGPSRGLINDLVAHALRRDLGLDVPADAVVITVGAQEAILITLRALIRSADDLLAVVSPCFVGARGAARLLDIDVVPIAEGADGVDFDQLESMCRVARQHGKRIRALYVSADFANPSGAVLDLAARHRLLDVADRHDLLLVEDNVYGFTAAPGAEIPPLKALDVHGRVIYVGTFAKVCLPGARVGFVVADQQVAVPDGTRRLLADELAAVKGMVTVNTSPICQAIIGGMLLESGGSLAALGAAKSELYRRNLGVLLAALDRMDGLPPGVTWNRPRGGFFVRMHLPCPADLALLEISASEHGVLWTPMSPFHLGGSGANEVRLSCSYLHPAEIVAGVDRLAGFLHKVGV